MGFIVMYCSLVVWCIFFVSLSLLLVVPLEFFSCIAYCYYSQDPIEFPTLSRLLDGSCNTVTRCCHVLNHFEIECTYMYNILFYTGINTWQIHSAKYKQERRYTPDGGL